MRAKFIPAMQRARGTVGVIVARDAQGKTSLVRLQQSGSSKVLTPRNHHDDSCDVVLLNTAGGIAGGDRFSVSIEARSNARMRVTTQAAERVYRSTGETAMVDVRLAVEAGAWLHWIPQETILFDASRIRRRLDVTLEGNARILLCEIVILGRKAQGEELSSLLFADAWRLRRNGRTVFADSVLIEGDFAARMHRSATCGHAPAAFATIVMSAPDSDRWLEHLRAYEVDASVELGASAFNGQLVVRVVGGVARSVREATIGILGILGERRLPRTW